MSTTDTIRITEGAAELFVMIDVAPGATWAYVINTPEQTRAARKALRDTGCESARVYTGNPDDLTGYETTDAVLTALPDCDRY